MRAEMPEVDDTAQKLEPCTLYLAKNKATGKVVTLMRLDKEVAVVSSHTITYITPDRDTGAVDMAWINSTYQIIRKYIGGDNLHIKN